MKKVNDECVILKKLHSKLLNNGFSFFLMEKNNEKITLCYEVRCGQIFHNIDEKYRSKLLNIDVVHEEKTGIEITIGICTIRDFNTMKSVTLMHGANSLSFLTNDKFDDLDSLLLIGRKILNATIIVESD